MKKVCHITTIHPPFDTRIFHKEIKTLVKAGYEVSLIAPQQTPDNDQMTNDKMATVVDGVRIIYLPKVRNRFFRIFCLTKQAYRLALEQGADIYHFHDPEFLYWAVKLKQKTGAKVIYDVHEDVPQQIISKEWIPQFFRKSIATVFNFYEKRKVRHLDFIIAATSKIKENFQKAGINNAEMITNYPVLKYFEQKTKNKKQKTYNGEIKLIYVGGLTRVRGIKEVVKSLDYIPNEKVKLILIGKFQEEGLEQELRALPEWEKVEFKGWLSQKEAYQEMRNSNIGLVCFLPEPNHINAIPNKIFEYMAAEIPVVASNFPLWKEIIEENKYGICVNPLEPKEIAKAIEYLIENSEEANKMGKNGRRAVLEKYNWEGESKKLLTIYQKLRNFKYEN